MTPEMRSFLDYLCGKAASSSLTEDIESGVKYAKANRPWEMEYMTLLERDERNIEKGIGIGEEMFVRLIQVLTEKGLQSEIDAVLKDKGYREVLYKKYGIK